MSYKPVNDAFRMADDAARRLGIWSEIQVISDPDGNLCDIAHAVKSALERTVAYRRHEEHAAGELAKAFAPGTDLGDLILHLHLLETEREQAGARFAARRRRPIHSARWRSFRQEFEEEIRSRVQLQGKSRKTVIQDVVRSASVLAARVLVEGWRTSKPRGKGAKEKDPRLGRKPVEKTAGIGGGFSVVLREVTAPELLDVLKGDPSTLGDRILNATLVGAGAYLTMTLSEKDDFLHGAFFSTTELELLLREARAFLVECVRNARGAALAELGRVATEDLSGGRTRREMVESRRSQQEVVLAGDIAEAVFDGMEAILEGEIPAVQVRGDGEEMGLRDCLDDERITDRDRAILNGRLKGKTWKEIATDLGISPTAARKAGSRTKGKTKKKKVSPPRK